MKHDFLDIYSDRDSPLHRLDPRVKAPALFVILITIISERSGSYLGFIVYYLLLFVLIAVSRLPLRFIFKRCLAASPFILAVAAFLPFSLSIGVEGTAAAEIEPRGFSEGIALAMTIILKAFAAVMVLTLLVSTTRFHHLLWAMRRLKAPKILCLLSSLMYRYIFILVDEFHKTTRARLSRTPGKLATNRFKVYGNQASVIFLRSWERSEIIYAAMLSRGFDGEFPEGKQEAFQPSSLPEALLIVVPFLVVRIWI